jgi:hypothetical protein
MINDVAVFTTNPILPYPGSNQDRGDRAPRFAVVPTDYAALPVDVQVASGVWGGGDGTTALTDMKKKLHGLSPRVNYTDRATAACRRSDCQLLRIEGVTWSA